jgi:hypothetical protein
LIIAKLLCIYEKTCCFALDYETQLKKSKWVAALSSKNLKPFFIAQHHTLQKTSEDEKKDPAF